MRRWVPVVVAMLVLAGAGVPASAAAAAPEFDPPSPCGSIVRFPLLADKTVVPVTASHPLDVVSVSLSASGLPGWASFDSSAGNPADGTITGRPRPLDFLLQFLGTISVATITAKESALGKTATCSFPILVGLL